MLTARQRRRLTGARRAKERLKRRFPIKAGPSYYAKRAGKITESASSYKKADIMEDAARRIAQHFGEARGRKLEILDAMAGEGKFGAPIAESLRAAGFVPQLEFLDMTPAMLTQVSYTGKRTLKDARWRMLPNKAYDAVPRQHQLYPH